MDVAHITVWNLAIVWERQSPHISDSRQKHHHIAPSETPIPFYFLTKLSDRLGFCAKLFVGGFCCGAGPPPPSNPFCLDLGFSGDSTPVLEGGLNIPTSGNPPPPGGPITLFLPRPPTPAFLLAPNPGRPACDEPWLVLSLSFAKSSERGDKSTPRFCLLAFSCLAWTERKCWRSSCHLMSSLPNFDRVAETPPTVDDFGAICKKPEELTALSLFLKETNAELCGNSINRPYKHLKRYGYFSGSRSWSLR